MFLLFEEPYQWLRNPCRRARIRAEVEQRGWSAVAFEEKYGLKLVGADFFLLGAADRVPVAVQCVQEVNETGHAKQSC